MSLVPINLSDLMTLLGAAMGLVPINLSDLMTLLGAAMGLVPINLSDLMTLLGAAMGLVPINLSELMTLLGDAIVIEFRYSPADDLLFLRSTFRTDSATKPTSKALWLTHTQQAQPRRPDDGPMMDASSARLRITSSGR